MFVLPIVCDKPNLPPTPSPFANGTDSGGFHAEDWICKLEPLSMLLYTHVAHWLVHLFVDQALKRKHKQSRVSGYVTFYLETVYFDGTCNRLWV